MEKIYYHQFTIDPDSSLVVPSSKFTCQAYCVSVEVALDTVGGDLQVKDLHMGGCNSLFTVFSDSKNTTFDSVQFSNYHSTEMILQREEISSWSAGDRQRAG